ncbi:hypothetical protein ACERJO_07795 [Halalkalibacter sp. AB-rgal2]
MLSKKRSKRYRFREPILDHNGDVTKESINELQTKLNKVNNGEKLALSSAESKVLTGVWVQFVGTFIEAMGTTEELQELKEEEDQEAILLERQAVVAIWLQTIGSGLSAFGYSLEVSRDEEKEIQGRKLGIIGSWFEAYGLAVEAIVETALLKADIEEQVPF